MVFHHSVKKWSNAGSCNWQRFIKTSTQSRADLRDRPLLKELCPHSSCKADSRNRQQKYASFLFQSTKELVDASHRPVFYFESHMICSAELAEDGKLGFRFTPADDLEEIDIGSGDHSRPTYISKKLQHKAKSQLTCLLKEFADFFVWEHHEMPGLGSFYSGA